jgi:hypothetical protein
MLLRAPAHGSQFRRSSAKRGRASGREPDPHEGGREAYVHVVLHSDQPGRCKQILLRACGTPASTARRTASGNTQEPRSKNARALGVKTQEYSSHTRIHTCKTEAT